MAFFAGSLRFPGLADKSTWSVWLAMLIYALWTLRSLGHLLDGLEGAARAESVRCLVLGAALAAMGWHASGALAVTWISRGGAALLGASALWAAVGLGRSERVKSE